MTCFLTVLHLTCAALKPLPGTGTGKPECTDDPVTVLARVHGSLFEPPKEGEQKEPPPWLYEVEPERIASEGCTHPIEILPAATRYPHCVVGNVERKPEDPEDTDVRPPYHGVCCSQGCKLAGPGEHIPYGTPIGYAEERAGRYQPVEDPPDE